MGANEMTYSGSAKGLTITRERAILEVRKHGCDVNEMLHDLGDHATYRASTVLAWLGY